MLPADFLNCAEAFTDHTPPPPSVRQILDGFFLGNLRDAEDTTSLSRNGVTHIVSIHNNAKPLLQEMTYLCIAASDCSSQNLIQHFKKCIKFIHQCRLHGGGCLVHCLAGVSRSTTIVVAYLMTVTTYGWEDCLNAVKAVRSYADPNLGFQQQLQEYEMTLLTEYRLWLQQEFGKNPFNDQDKVGKLLSERAQKMSLRETQNLWINQPDTGYILPHKAYGGRSRWTN
ncbi:dual specificity protein phosphatase 22-A-like isoform X2 [Pyxicephalus adspersus]|uniref:dual specificity protein phosphatase 22-A-like isoform X2 n=1 Tax=Pyxicephalus adspersus TaxID=30357 RepID=UPI003B5A2F83